MNRVVELIISLIAEVCIAPTASQHTSTIKLQILVRTSKIVFKL